jgi:hypothetical protein
LKKYNVDIELLSGVCQWRLTPEVNESLQTITCITPYSKKKNYTTPPNNYEVQIKKINFNIIKLYTILSFQSNVLNMILRVMHINHQNHLQPNVICIML